MSRGCGLPRGGTLDPRRAEALHRTSRQEKADNGSSQQSLLHRTRLRAGQSDDQGKCHEGHGEEDGQAEEAHASTVRRDGDLVKMSEAVPDTAGIRWAVRLPHYGTVAAEAARL